MLYKPEKQTKASLLVVSLQLSPPQLRKEKSSLLRRTAPPQYSLSTLLGGTQAEVEEAFSHADTCMPAGYLGWHGRRKQDQKQVQSLFPGPDLGPRKSPPQ